MRSWGGHAGLSPGLSKENLFSGVSHHVKQPSVVALEQSESRGSVELATLRRAAEALDCTLVYALIPNKPLETMVRERAHGFVRLRRAPIEHSMLLEAQGLDDDGNEERLDVIIRETNPRLFWD